MIAVFSIEVDIGYIRSRKQVVQTHGVVVLDRGAEGLVQRAFVCDVGVHTVERTVGRRWRDGGRGCAVSAEVGEGGGEAGGLGAELGEVVGC